MLFSTANEWNSSGFQGCWICDLTCCEALHHLQAHLLQCDAQLDIVVDWSTSLGDVDQLHGVGRVFSVDLGAVWPEVAAVKALCCQQKNVDAESAQKSSKHVEFRNC